MTRARLLAAAALAAAACGSSTPAPQTAQLRQPSAIALFRGYTIDDAEVLKPYLAIANASRNDLTLVDAVDDSVVLAPVQLRPLAVPVAGRPALLASASFGDGENDVLVVVSAGDSVVQVVNTWAPTSEVFSDPAPPPPATPLAVDLGADVVALVPLPAPAGTARIAAALAGHGIALVEYVRGDDGKSVKLNATTIRSGLAFQPLALAAMPDDEAVAGVQTAIYAATLDPVSAGVFGVAEIPVDEAGTLGTVNALGARAPTRLVAAARLRERQDGSGAANETAFAGQPRVPRVYAVLDEGSCGPLRRIDCGVVTLDPAKPPLPGDGDSIPEDWAGVMPYRAPIRIPARPVALAVSPPPVNPPSDAEALYQDDFMRLATSADAVAATTAVGVVASEDGNLYFLDLGRFAEASSSNPATSLAATAAPPAFTGGVRLWLREPDGGFAGSEEGPAAIARTLGYTPTQAWTVTWQGLLPGLANRTAEAGSTSTNGVWLAIQVADGAPRPGRAEAQVAQLYHPALGVKAGDVVVIRAATVPGCTGTVPPGAAEDAGGVFDVTVASLLAPTEDYPGGALLLEPPTAPAEWVTCFGALRTAIGTTASRHLLVEVRSPELLLVDTLGYAGRPALSSAAPDEPPFVLQYEDEDALSCPLADWAPPSPAPACDDASCRDACERLVLARKARRVHHHTVDGPPPNGPALGFRVGVEAEPGTPSTPARGLALRFSTVSGVTPLLADPGGASVHPSGALAFDRSPLDAASGYRFFVSYPADFVADVSPSVFPASLGTIR